jgi:hypothetical protein
MEETKIPAKSKSQQKFFGMQLAKKKAGKKTDVDMSKEEMTKMASTKQKGLPEKVKDKKAPAKKATKKGKK